MSSLVHPEGMDSGNGLLQNGCDAGIEMMESELPEENGRAILHDQKV